MAELDQSAFNLGSMGVAAPAMVAAVRAAVMTFATDKVAYYTRPAIKHIDFT